MSFTVTREIIADLDCHKQMNISLCDIREVDKEREIHKIIIGSVFKRCLNCVAYSRSWLKAHFRCCKLNFCFWRLGTQYPRRYIILKLKSVWIEEQDLRNAIEKKNQYFVVEKGDIAGLNPKAVDEVRVKRFGPVTSLEVVKIPKEQMQEV